MSLLGLGSAAVAALPIDELIDRLAFARSPTSSIYLPGGASDPFYMGYAEWEDDVFHEYVRTMYFTAPTTADEARWIDSNRDRIVFLPA